MAGEVRRELFPGGLQVLTEQVPLSRTFSLGFFVPVGSRHETSRLSGASHFLEHLLFKGTRQRSAEQISIAVESVGGDLNAYTAKEHTCFYARVLDADAALATEVLADMLTGSLIRSTDVDAERAVILDEIAMHGDDPAEVAQELIMNALFGDQGLGAPVIGSSASIRALTRRQVAGHWLRHYRPDTMVVAATGHVDHDRLVEQLAPLAAPNEPAPPQPPKRAQFSAGGGLITAYRRVEQSTAVLAFPGRGVFDPGRYPLGLLSVILGGGMSSRLFVEVRERRGLTYGIDAGEAAYTDAGIWTVDWQCAPEKLLEITALVRAILGEVAEHGVSADELARAQGQVRGQTMLAFEGPIHRMSRLGGNALIGDERTLNDLIDGYQAVTPAEVQDVAQALFAQPPVMAVVGPRVATARLRRLLAAWSS